MRVLVARCEVRYSGRLQAVLPEALRLLMIKSDGSVMVHADTGGYKPQNWMTPPTVIEESEDAIVVRKRAGASEDRLDIRLAEVVSDVAHDMGEAAALQKHGVERELQELLADAPLVGHRACQYELTADTHFLIAPHPEHDGRVWLMGGASGHGFKHGPALAERMEAWLTEAEPPEPRFALGERVRDVSLRTAGLPT